MTGPPLSRVYGALHEACQAAALDLDVCPSSVRMLVAVHELAGQPVGPTSADFAALIGTNPTQVRRSSLELRRAGLLAAKATRGVGSAYRVTRRGRRVADDVLGAARAVLA